MALTQVSTLNNMEMLTFYICLHIESLKKGGNLPKGCDGKFEYIEIVCKHLVVLLGACFEASPYNLQQPNTISQKQEESLLAGTCLDTEGQ